MYIEYITYSIQIDFCCLFPLSVDFSQVSTMFFCSMMLIYVNIEHKRKRMCGK